VRVLVAPNVDEVERGRDGAQLCRTIRAVVGVAADLVEVHVVDAVEVAAKDVQVGLVQLDVVGVDLVEKSASFGTRRGVGVEVVQS